MVNRNEYSPDHVTPPGSTLRTVLSERGVRHAEFATRVGLSEKTVSLIITGKAPITPETALVLERVLGVPAGFWNERERLYREALARITDDKLLARHSSWAKRFPVRAMQKLAWIPAVATGAGRVKALLAFFGTASIDQWEIRYGATSAAFRASTASKSDRYAVAAWLRQGERAAEGFQTADYDATKFRNALQAIRELTVLEPSEFEPRLTKLCADAGVAVAVVPPLKRVPVYGATRWMTDRKALIALSLRGKTNDHFWFTLFHEAGHILKHGKKQVFIEQTTPSRTHVALEREADRFACEILIPEQDYQRFCGTHIRPSPADITRFASKLRIAPGIVVGRLQHDDKLNFNSAASRLKVSYRFVAN